MIGLTFHNPENILEHLDREKFLVTIIRSEEDALEFQRRYQAVEDFRNEVLLIRSLDRLFDLAKQYDFHKTKVFVFDNPNKFFQYRLIYADAIPGSDGIWKFRKLPGPLIRAWLSEMAPGLELEADQDLDATPWTY